MIQAKWYIYLQHQRPCGKPYSGPFPPGLRTKFYDSRSKAEEDAFKVHNFLTDTGKWPQGVVYGLNWKQLGRETK